MFSRYLLFCNHFKIRIRMVFKIDVLDNTLYAESTPILFRLLEVDVV